MILRRLMIKRDNILAKD